MVNKTAQNQRGFTLIELLIVIVIIGILAGIVITILNPARQQARARDGVVVATINKIQADAKAFAAGDISGVGSYPTCDNLVASLQNVTGAVCASNYFNISGVTLGTSTMGTQPQGFKYIVYTNTNGSQICISAPANDTSVGGNTIIRYDSGDPAYLTPSRTNTPC